MLVSNGAGANRSILVKFFEVSSVSTPSFLASSLNLLTLAIPAVQFRPAIALVVTPAFVDDVVAEVLLSACNSNDNCGAPDGEVLFFLHAAKDKAANKIVASVVVLNVFIDVIILVF